MSTAATQTAAVTLPGIDYRAAFDAARILMRDPNRLDQVLRLGEAINRGAFERLWGTFQSTAEGRAILAERPRLDEAHVDFTALAALPEGTLGREYADFLRTHGISPKPFENAPQGIDPRASYLVLRMRQTHDVWHVLRGQETSVAEELYLQAFTYAQIGAPLSLVLCVGGTLRYGWRYRGFLRNMWRSYRAGKRAKPLAPTYWERHWSEPVATLREQLGVERFPRTA
jgi:ubiquinone biosynthesis protein COQ4